MRKGAPARKAREHEAVPAKPERLQKVLAEAGIGSRREIERWIEQGRIRVDGQVAVLGVRVTPRQKIQIDDRLVSLQRKATLSRVVLLNKAAGTICTRTDPEGRPTVFEDLPSITRGRWVVVGRLDAMTTGLLLFTDDGELAHRLMHPSSMLDREYAVRVDGMLTEAEIATLRAGVVIGGQTMHFTDIRHFDGRGRNHWYHVVLMEGKQHEVKLLFGAIERVVSRLKRVRFGPVILPSRLTEGRCEELSSSDVNQLRRLVGLEPGPTVAGAGRHKSVLLPYPPLEERRGNTRVP
jgi:23S rRNA pseudouridine2605 synthase